MEDSQSPDLSSCVPISPSSDTIRCCTFEHLCENCVYLPLSIFALMFVTVRVVSMFVTLHVVLMFVTFHVGLYVCDSSCYFCLLFVTVRVVVMVMTIQVVFKFVTDHVYFFMFITVSYCFCIYDRMSLSHVWHTEET